MDMKFCKWEFYITFNAISSINEKIQIDKIINKLELDYKYAETTKIIYDNSIVYSNFDYSVISCNTNSKYIISYNDILYNDNFCN